MTNSIDTFPFKIRSVEQDQAHADTAPTEHLETVHLRNANKKLNTIVAGMALAAGVGALAWSLSSGS